MATIEQDTETKIKEAARKIFHEKGFVAAKTRDIAEAAGINLALLNYYFRSKKKLYDMIMLETIANFFGSIEANLNNENSSLKEKLAFFVNKYMDIISENPDIPLFIINEAKTNPTEFASKLTFLRGVSQSVFAQQFQEEVKKGNIPTIHPIHFLMNTASLIVFPFLASPLIKAVSQSTDNQMNEILNDRRRLIPLWIEAMLNVK